MTTTRPNQDRKWLLTAASTPSTVPGRLRWAFADALTLTNRALLHWSHQPGQLVVGLLFPVMTLVMFAYLFGGAMAIPDGNYREFLVPGVFALTMVFGLESTFAAVAADARRGITDRFRAMPMTPSAALVGRCLADMLHSAVGLAVLFASGLAIGWRPHHGLAATLGAVAFLLLLRLAMVWVGIALGLLTKNPEAVVAVQILVWPIGFLSNVFVAPATLPGALRAIAEWNPLSATAAASRDLFGNPGWNSASWASQHAMLMALLWPLLLLAVFFPLSVSLYRRLDT